MKSELVADLLDMELGCALRDKQLAGDLTVGQSLGDQLRNFTFTMGERERRCVHSGGLAVAAWSGALLT
jgi:hypothetical protein